MENNLQVRDLLLSNVGHYLSEVPVLSMHHRFSVIGELDSSSFHDQIPFNHNHSMMLKQHTFNHFSKYEIFNLQHTSSF